MKTDKFWMSAIWGRVGAALILIVGTVLQSLGIEVTQDQMDGANSVIGDLINNVHIVIAAAMVLISKLRESKKLGTVSQSGKACIALMLGISLFCAIFMGAGLFGCAVNQSQSAAQQLLQRTGDQSIILKGTFADAQDLYIKAQDTYKPWQKALQKTNPALDKEIIAYFGKANEILDDWELNSDVPINDKKKFHEYLYEISLQIAMKLEERYQK